MLKIQEGAATLQEELDKARAQIAKLQKEMDGVGANLGGKDKANQEAKQMMEKKYTALESERNSLKQRAEAEGKRAKDLEAELASIKEAHKRELADLRSKL